MPSNYEVTADYINVPGMSLVVGADAGVTATLEPDESYTIEAGITINDVPSWGSTDHCQSGFNGGARVEMEVTSGSGTESVTQCISGPPGESTSISMTLTAAGQEGLVEDVWVSFRGAESGEMLSDSTKFEIETLAPTEGGDDSYDVTVDRITTPGFDFDPATRDNVGVVGEVDPTSTYTVGAELRMNKSPGFGDPDHCSIDGARVDMVVIYDGGMDSVRESVCVLGPQGTVTEVEVEVPAPNEGGVVDDIVVDFVGSDSGANILTGVEFQVETSTIGGGSDSPDFDLDTVESSCSISQSRITEGDMVEVDVDLEGSSPDRNTYDVGVTLVVNGEPVAEGVGKVTANGASGESFEVSNLPVGENSIGYELSNLGVT